MTSTTPSTAPLPEWKDFIRLEIDGLTFYGEDCDHASITAGAYTKLRSALLSAQSGTDVAKAVALDIPSVRNFIRAIVFHRKQKTLSDNDKVFGVDHENWLEEAAYSLADTLTKDNPNG